MLRNTNTGVAYRQHQRYSTVGIRQTIKRQDDFTTRGKLDRIT